MQAALQVRIVPDPGSFDLIHVLKMLIHFTHPSLQFISLLCINSFQLLVPDIDNFSKLICIFVWACFGSINTLLCSPGGKETFIQSCLTRCLPLSNAPFSQYVQIYLAGFLIIIVLSSLCLLQFMPKSFKWSFVHSGVHFWHLISVIEIVWWILLTTQ